MLDAGDYVILFEKPGEYGPDVQAITVVDPETAPPVIWIPEAAIGVEDSLSSAAEIELETEADEIAITEAEERVVNPPAIPPTTGTYAPGHVFQKPSSSSSSSSSKHTLSLDDFWNF